MSAVQQPSSILPSQHLLQSSQQNGVRAGSTPAGDPPAILTLIPLNGTFEKKQITLPYFPETLRIGRQTNAKTVPTSKNGFFDSKVLSRQHAEIWADRATGKVLIRDVKSSNGTFLNGQRLSPENRESEAHEIRENDTLELGIDIVSEDQKTIVHHKVSAKVEHAGVYGTVPNIFDLTLGDLDPASGNGLLPSPLSQPLSHLRGRAGSASSTRSAQSNASSQFNALQQQRQMNYWSSPLSIEQVVKRLTVGNPSLLLEDRANITHSPR
jgi:pSer/pThr/pTyr-binding forkhead associated (FHA) protein